MKKKSLLLIACLTCLSLTACGETKKQSMNYTHPTFEKDGNTLSKDEADVWKIESAQKEEKERQEERNNQVSYDSYEHLGEITLINENTDMNWELSEGKDVIYNGVFYHDLYTNVSNAESPYDTNALINFIVKSYDANDNEIYTSLSTDVEYEYDENDAEGENTNITIDEQLGGSRNYEALKEKYNSEATWMLEIFSYGGKHKGIIAGCKEFICFINMSSDIVVDMSEYTFEEQNKTEQLTEQTTEISTEQTETYTTEEFTETEEKTTETVEAEESTEQTEGETENE